MSVLPKTLPKKTKTAHNFGKQPRQQDNSTLIFNTCMKILMEQPLEQINKWLIQNKVTSTQLKNEKLSMVINHSEYVLKTMLVDNEVPDAFLIRIIAYYKYNNKKCYEFCRFLKHFAARDYELDYLLTMAKGQCQQPVSFYLKCRNAIVESHINKGKRDIMRPIIVTAEQWFTTSKKIFKGVSETQLIEIFTDTCKSHYLQIKKNQNQDLHGDQFFKVCLIIRKILQQKKQGVYENYSDDGSEYVLREPGSNPVVYRNSDLDGNEEGRRTSKQFQAKRIFQANTLDGLQSQDRQLIRMLSYRDTNIARLLQKKHEKMIQMIANEVDQMRRNIEGQKNKYIELCRQKDEAISASQNINKLTIEYIRNNNMENEQKVLNAIQDYSRKYGKTDKIKSTLYELNEVREQNKNGRLIEIIERQQRQID